MHLEHFKKSSFKSHPLVPFKHFFNLTKALWDFAVSLEISTNLSASQANRMGCLSTGTQLISVSPGPWCNAEEPSYVALATMLHTGSTASCNPNPEVYVVPELFKIDTVTPLHLHCRQTGRSLSKLCFLLSFVKTTHCFQRYPGIYFTALLPL